MEEDLGAVTMHTRDKNRGLLKWMLELVISLPAVEAVEKWVIAERLQDLDSANCLPAISIKHQI